MTQINFKAQLQDKTFVQRLTPDNSYQEQKVFFAKMNPYSQADCKSVRDISQLWGEDTYVATMLRHSQREYDPKVRNVYFLTTQDCKFRKIKPENVLGMVEVTELGRSTYMNFIQTNPNLKYGNEKRAYTGVGWAMLEMIDKTFKDTEIWLQSVPKAIEFYLKYGFEKSGSRGYKYQKMVLKRTNLPM